MRDQHRPKQDLITEVVALRKQVDDLKEAMAARRRVEDALRNSEEQLRALVDGLPVGLCIFQSDGGAVAANQPFARMLGYDSAAELLSMSKVLGVFANRDEQARIAELFTQGEERAGEVLFSHKSGGPHAARVMGAVSREPDAIVLVVLESLSAASPGDMRSG
jgi:PAS domain S-box-containing protein